VALLEYDVSTSFSEEVGLSWADLEAGQAELERRLDTLVADREAGLLPFLDLPEVNHDRLCALAADARERFTELVVLGIGGSSLGARALIEALHGCDVGATAHRRVRFCENVDPDEVHALLASVDWDRTQWNVVTKSGSTIETWATFLVVWDELVGRFGHEGARERVIVTTGAERGPLRAFAREESLVALEAPSGVGGRFSVFTPAGLYPCAFAGINTKELLSGAARARSRCLSRDALDNPAAVFASLQVLHYRAGRPIVVFMPYVQRFAAASEWFCQLWAESLGKRSGDERIGPTPVRALGVTDQHSQLQLYMEGPRDKNIVFVEVREFRNRVVVPICKSVSAEVAHLGGKDLAQILKAELAGTRQSLLEEGCPSSTFVVRDASAESLGALMMTLEIATVVAGGLLEIDPFNQPGIELGKRYAHGLLGRSKESHYADSLSAAEAARTVRKLTI
jgi:glucose-6-phosphate isomerase